jgi:hypothetical protein
MQSSFDLFATLAAQYPDYAAMKQHLVGLGIQENSKEGDPLVIFRYNRETADLKNPVVRAFRSVIWDTVSNRPVFVAPQKSEPIETLPPLFQGTHIVEDFVDGVMVNVFMDPHKKTWRLATRSRLDADNKFYQHTFAELFMAAWNGYFPGADFSTLTPAYAYSFVIQHPQNRIVVPVGVPSLTCVEISHIEAATGRLFNMATPMTMMPPRRFNVNSGPELGLLMAQREQFEGFTAQGCVIREMATGRRWKVRTQAYMKVRQLRGNHSRLEYTWFENLQKGTLEAYLTVYPEERAAATATTVRWNAVVSEIYNWYVKVYKVRDTAKSAIPAQYRGVLFDLHGQYLSRLAPAKQSLTWAECQAIMSRQDLKRQVFLTTFTEGAGAPRSAVKRAALKEAKAVARASAPSAAGGGGGAITLEALEAEMGV